MNEDISKARARAKRIARDGQTTHQQALDMIAREAGYAHWSNMLQANGGENVASAVDAQAKRISHYVETYEFRSDDGDVMPTPAECVEIEKAIAGFMANDYTAPKDQVVAYVLTLSLPHNDDGLRRLSFITDAIHGYLDFEMDHVRAISPFEIDRFPFLPGPPAVTRYMENGQPRIATKWQLDLTAKEEVHADVLRASVRPALTIASVERDMKRIMGGEISVEAAKRASMKLSDWISSRIRSAANVAIAHIGDERPKGQIAELAITSDVTAYAMDPDHGPHERHDRMTVRCPLHDDKNPSLSIKGMDMRCHAGCKPDALQARFTDRLVQAGAAAISFMAANDASPVIEGWALREETGGMGGGYRLSDGRRFELEALACRMLPSEYPKWDFSDLK